MTSMNHQYMQCTRCVMDTSATDIFFNQNGVCSYCSEYEIYGKEVLVSDFSHRDAELVTMLEKIKKSRRGDYDCIIGLSGGADSTYVAYLAVKHGLKPLAIHLDNGWNAELAVKNIESTVKGLNLDLITHVIDWEEFRDIQLSFFKAGVIDLEMPTDHAIGVLLYRLAKRFGLKYFLSGTNLATEAMMPSNWFFNNKLDPINLRAIYRQFGSGRKLRTFPIFRVDEYVRRKYFSPIHVVSFLNYFDYHKPRAVALLEKEIGYVPYPIKHYESVFTRFYQGYILPRKFNVDKRRPFFSTMIMTGQMTRSEALDQLNQDPYEPRQLQQDRPFVLKKLGIDNAAFEKYMNKPEVNHLEYSSLTSTEHKLQHLKRRIKSQLKK